MRQVASRRARKQRRCHKIGLTHMEVGIRIKGEGIVNLFDDQRKLGSNTPSYGFEEIDLDEGWDITEQYQ